MPNSTSDVASPLRTFRGMIILLLSPCKKLLIGDVSLLVDRQLCEICRQNNGQPPPPRIIVRISISFAPTDLRSRHPLPFESVAPILRINYPLRWSVMCEMHRDMHHGALNVCMPQAYHWASGMAACSFRIWHSRLSAHILLFSHFVRVIQMGYALP